MDKKNNNDNNNDEILNSLDFGLEDDAVSHWETTGLIPALAEDDYETDSYKEIDEYRPDPMPEKS